MDSNRSSRKLRRTWIKQGSRRQTHSTYPQNSEAVPRHRGPRAIKPCPRLPLAPLGKLGTERNSSNWPNQETGSSSKFYPKRKKQLYAFEGAKSANQAFTPACSSDLGGGSLEMVNYSEPTIKKILSVPLGGLRLTDIYAKPDGSYTKKNYARMRKRILELYRRRNIFLHRKS